MVPKKTIEQEMDKTMLAPCDLLLIANVADQRAAAFIIREFDT